MPIILSPSCQDEEEDSLCFWVYQSAKPGASWPGASWPACLQLQSVTCPSSGTRISIWPSYHSRSLHLYLHLASRRLCTWLQATTTIKPQLDPEQARDGVRPRASQSQPEPEQDRARETQPEPITPRWHHPGIILLPRPQISPSCHHPGPSNL